MSASLVFANSGKGASLVFGAESGSTGAGQIVAALDFPEFAVQVLAATRTAAQGAIRFPEFVVSASVRYDQNVDRPVATEARSTWHEGTAAAAHAQARWQSATGAAASTQARWQAGRSTLQAASLRWADSQHTRASAATAWQAGQRRRAATRSRWQDGERLQRTDVLAWQDGAALRQAARSCWQDMLHTARPQLNARWQHGRGEQVATSSRAGAGRAIRLRIVSRWQNGITPPPGKWTLPTEPVTPHPTASAALLFQRTGNGADLVFGWVDESGAKFVVPARRTYIVFDSVTLARVDNGAAIGIYALDISIDRDSWVCSWSAEVSRSEWAGLYAEAGAPLQLRADINGYSWLLTAEGAPSRSRAFGTETIRIKGRGIACELASTYAPAGSWHNDAQATAQQLAASALTLNGASIGWALDWQIDDWVTPAGVWSFQGAPIDAVLDVVGAVRAVVQADPAARTLRVLPRYPAAPWEWSALRADIEIPLDALDEDSLEPVIRPDYNAIYISGETQGVVARVLRAGTAGDRIAPTVTHPLICSTIPARMRGIAELGDTGRQARISITMDVSEDMPLLQVGQLAAFSEVADPWRGVVTGMSISARMDSDVLVVSQQAEIERHYA